VQRPHTQNIIDFPAILGKREHVDKQASGVSTGEKRSDRMPPETMAGIAAAKVSRKKNFTSS
jgi:hypothetical protein